MHFPDGVRGSLRNRGGCLRPTDTETAVSPTIQNFQMPTFIPLLAQRFGDFTASPLREGGSMHWRTLSGQHCSTESVGGDLHFSRSSTEAHLTRLGSSPQSLPLGLGGMEVDGFDEGARRSVRQPLLSASPAIPEARSSISMLRQICIAFFLLNAAIAWIVGWMMKHRHTSMALVAVHHGWNLDEKSRACWLAGIYYIVAAVVSVEIGVLIKVWARFLRLCAILCLRTRNGLQVLREILLQFPLYRSAELMACSFLTTLRNQLGHGRRGSSAGDRTSSRIRSQRGAASPSEYSDHHVELSIIRARDSSTNSELRQRGSPVSGRI